MSDIPYNIAPEDIVEELIEECEAKLALLREWQLSDEDGRKDLEERIETEFGSVVNPQAYV